MMFVLINLGRQLRQKLVDASDNKQVFVKNKSNQKHNHNKK